MTRTFTEDDMDLISLGFCLDCGVHCPTAMTAVHDPTCPQATGLGTARGDVTVPGEVCTGCRQPFQAGEAYQPCDDGYRCLGCAAQREEAS